MDPNREAPQSVFNTQHSSVLKFIETGDSKHHCLYRHQKDAVRAATEHLQDSSKPNTALVVLPTGCGKSGVAVLTSFALNATRVLVITPSAKISDQIYGDFCGEDNAKMFFVKRGIVTNERDIDLFRPRARKIKQASQVRQALHFDLLVVNAHKIGGASSVAIDQIPRKTYDLVIVDEAHHYPAPTWKLLVDHFDKSRRLFLTATPLYRGNPILPTNHECYQLTRKEAVDRGVIRKLKFQEVVGESSMEAIARKIKQSLDNHDQQDNSVNHQAMVLTQTISDLNSATYFKDSYNQLFQSPGARPPCEMYHSKSPKQVLERFDRHELRVLVIVGRLLEGYDNNHVSVVGIARNVAPTSKVLFAQFVGRAVRKARVDDPVTAIVVSHVNHQQEGNFDEFDKVRSHEQDDVEEQD